MKTNPSSFQESQVFARAWLTVSMVLSEIGMIVILILAIEDNKIQGLDFFSTLIFLTVSSTPSVLLVLSYMTKLEVKISEESIQFKWIPFQKKFSTIKKSEIRRLDLIQFSFIGFGLRFSGKYGEAHVVAGNEGLWIEKLNGSKYLLGTQKPKEVKEIINEKYKDLVK